MSPGHRHPTTLSRSRLPGNHAQPQDTGTRDWGTSDRARATRGKHQESCCFSRPGARAS
jgi:hypothetical protein